MYRPLKREIVIQFRSNDEVVEERVLDIDAETTVESLLKSLTKFLNDTAE